MAKLPDGLAVFFTASEDGKSVDIESEEIVLCKNCEFFDWNWCTRLKTYSKGQDWYCADGKAESEDERRKKDD